ncbi:major facilitator superfamily transporter [Xylariaceae sp. FL0016]|nr:major facilitator superfamily transporter [Xylariaceae sp. FL0016]
MSDTVSDQVPHGIQRQSHEVELSTPHDRRPSSLSANSDASSKQSRNGDTGENQEQSATAEPMSEAPVYTEAVYSIFTTWEKRTIVLGAAVGAFFSPLSGQIYYPALTPLSEDLGVSLTQINLTVTTYMIFQGLTPMFVGTFADATGRRPAYLFCFVVYIAANIGCALAPNYAALLVLRMLQSAGASTTVSLCQAVVSDIITSAERGNYVGWTTIPVMLGPALGPVLGGIFAQYLGWRWIFWFLTIASGFVFVLYAIFMPETCRTIVGDGSIRPHPYYRTVWQLTKDALRKRRRADDLTLQQTPSRVSTKKSFRLKRPNPLKTLSILFEKEMFLLLGYSSFIYAAFYAIATALPAQFSDLYGFDELTVGLMYLPFSGGAIIAAVVMGKLQNWNYRRHCKLKNVPFDRTRQQDLAAFPIEKARLEVSIPLLAVFTVLLIAWGWAIEYRAPLAVPIVLLLLIGITLVGFSNAANTLIVDINPGSAGAATAANNFTRCLIGAAATAVINPMMNSIGSGWSFTIIALIFAGLSPCLWFVMKNGVQWRRAKAERKQHRREQKERKRSGVIPETQEARAHQEEELEQNDEEEKNDGTQQDDDRTTQLREPSDETAAKHASPAR